MQPNDGSPELVLAANATLQDAADLPGAETGDMIVDRPDRRTHPKLVNAQLAALLQEFRQPRRLPQAVASLVSQLDADPFALLQQAAPVIAELRQCGILETHGATPAPTRRFHEGTGIAGYLVHRILRQTQDTEVALATDENGATVALKTPGNTCGDAAANGFAREIEIARSLSGDIAPRVLDVVRHLGAPILVTEWIDALPLDRYARTCCLTAKEQAQLAANVVDAYARLHAAGLLHGDIRPSNILVDGDGRVHLVDFGLSQRAGPTALRLGFELDYLEPEAADMLRLGNLPPLTAAGEVCSLALVLAEALAGQSMRSLPALRDAALAEIAGNTPVIQTGLPDVDATLQGSVLPIDRRQTDLRQLKSRLKRAASPLPAAAPSLATPRAGASVDRAILLQRRAELTDDPACLALAGACLRAAQGRTRPGPDTASPLYAPMARTVQCARLAYASTRFDTARDRLSALARLARTPRAAAELFDGSAGDLAHLARFHADYAPADARIQDLAGPLASLLARQLDRLEAALDGLERGAATHLGMAHGLCGQTYAALRATRVLGQTPATVIARALTTLKQHALPVASGLAWPGTVNADGHHPVTTDLAPGWCNGSAGFLLLWMDAADAFPDGGHASLAEATALYSLGHPDETGNLCCGRAGRAIALAAYARWSGSGEWAAHAHKMAHAIPAQACNRSLFRGQPGVELAQIETAMPSPRFPV